MIHDARLYMVYTTETICCWSALVQYDFLGEFMTCVLRCTLSLAAVYPQEELSSLLPQLMTAYCKA